MTPINLSFWFREFEGSLSEQIRKMSLENQIVEIPFKHKKKCSDDSVELFKIDLKEVGRW